MGDEADAAAVVSAFGDGVRTAGAPPHALLLDNRASNHTDAVDAALGDDTIKIRTTLSRPQNKVGVATAFVDSIRAVTAFFALYRRAFDTKGHQKSTQY